MYPAKSTAELLDRLVDGELSEPERKELLLSLDQEPDGWRQCALAFLEAQCWKKELKSIRQPLATNYKPTVPAHTSIISKNRSKLLSIAGTLLAMSACFFITLSSVLWYRGGNLPGSIAGTNQIQGKTNTSVVTNKSLDANAGEASAPWQWVRLSPSGSTDSKEAIELPAIERDRFDPQWVQSLPSPIPEDVVQALRRNGYEVHSQQRLLPMPLKDGRQLVVPVDNVQVQYVGNPTY